MSQVNIIVPLVNNDPAYIYSNVRYARVDNTVAPVWQYLNNITTSPLVITNVENGQYRIYATPFYSDGRICPEQVVDTAACARINSFSAVESGANFEISYSAETSVPAVKVNINYPNGGFSSSIHTNDGNDILIPVPANIYGTYYITMQPVCDEDTGWYGAQTAAVTVEIPEPSP